MTLRSIIHWLVAQPRWVKRALLAANDFALLSLAIWAAFSLRLGAWYEPPTVTMTLLLLAAPTIGVAVFFARGLYKLVTRYIGHESALRIYGAIGIATMLWGVVVLLVDVEFFPRSVLGIYPFLAAVLIRLSRHGAAYLLRFLPGGAPSPSDERTRVVIYGAGVTGVQLFRALAESGRYRTVAFVDDDASIQGQIVHGVKVFHADKLSGLIDRHAPQEIMLAMPSARRADRREAIRRLEPFPVVVKTLPALEEIASGDVQISDLRPIDVDDLLGRDPVPPDETLLKRSVAGKSVMITGAGGTIGSELARQALQLRPKRLVLFELSEVALYDIEARIAEAAREMEGGAPEIVAVLGSVIERRLVRNAIMRHGVETIYHAAAYKHVPIVEHNAIVGIENNTFGTLAIAEVARELGVERFVLVSTDKAVRPTSIMGASKRLAEMTLQALAADNGGGTVFTMVRFGNVLDSSGSVVRLFRQQISQGGPVTVTHREIIRYFMSIPEAAQLVIQAGAMAEGGEVFVLDMGQPVKIDDLARTMIRLSGLEARDAETPDGDIEIQYVGLRQGEKLYEELLIGENTTLTSHARIRKAAEPFLDYSKLSSELARLKSAMAHDDPDALKAVLSRSVEGYAAEDPSEAASVSMELRDPARTLH
jgi:FlaA1/EpsC-like NDP-sugar epimerase